MQIQNSEVPMRYYGDWKARYSKLYSPRTSAGSMHDSGHQISFLGKEPSSYLSMKFHPLSEVYKRESSPLTTPKLTTLLPEQSELYTSYLNMFNKNEYSKVNTETLLLDMVRAKSRDIEQENQDKTLKLPRDDVSETRSSDVCLHSLAMRMTDRSMSRRSISRVSRISQRRDMDIPSILAFTATVTPPPAPLLNPDFQKVVSTDQAIPRWSIRKAVCPVCSQKWRDKSSISIIKCSGLKRSTASDLPSVIAPARLRSAITMEYNPRPVMATIDESSGIGMMRNSSATWQLTRARRFRAPKPQMPSPEATAPPSATAPMARKDLDTRVHRFLTDEGMSKYLLRASFIK